MRKTLLVAAAVGSFSSFALANSPAAAPNTVHVKLEVQPNLYGSFTEKRDVPVGQPSVLERTNGEPKRVDYSGPCKVDLPVGMPATILDRTRIVVAPFAARTMARSSRKPASRRRSSRTGARPKSRIAVPSRSATARMQSSATPGAIDSATPKRSTRRTSPRRSLRHTT